MYYIGLISGTSMDGVDAALAHFDQQNRVRLAAALNRPYPEELRQRLSRAAEHPQTFTMSQLGQAHAELAREFAAAAVSLLETAGLAARDVRAIGSHGQTLLHAPQAQPAYSLQLGDPGALAALTGIPVVADFRSTDIALGGQGAPLMPAFHEFAFSHATDNRAVVNIGGIANLSLLPAGGPTTGFDCGPGNCLLDAWYRQHQTGPFDDRGAWSASGQVQKGLLESLLRDPYFAQPAPKSTGTDYFNGTWLGRALEGLREPPSPVDVQATLLELTARSIAEALERSKLSPGTLAVCGGGAHNEHLLTRLHQHLAPVTVETSLAWGIEPDWVEAAGFAWLARERIAERPSSLPTVTGATHAASLGGLYLPPRQDL